MRRRWTSSRRPVVRSEAALPVNKAHCCCSETKVDTPSNKAGQQPGLTPEYAAKYGDIASPSDRAAEEAEPSGQTGLEALQAETSMKQEEEEAHLSLPPGLDEEPPGAAHPAVQVQ